MVWRPLGHSSTVTGGEAARPRAGTARKARGAPVRSSNAGVPLPGESGLLVAPTQPDCLKCALSRSSSGRDGTPAVEIEPGFEVASVTHSAPGKCGCGACPQKVFKAFH